MDSFIDITLYLVAAWHWSELQDTSVGENSLRFFFTWNDLTCCAKPRDYEFAWCHEVGKQCRAHAWKTPMTKDEGKWHIPPAKLNANMRGRKAPSRFISNIVQVPMLLGWNKKLAMKYSSYMYCARVFSFADKIRPRDRLSHPRNSWLLLLSSAEPPLCGRSPEIKRKQLFLVTPCC